MEIIDFLMSDVGLSMFTAWVLFVAGIVNISREVRIFAADYSKKIYSSSRGGFIRVIFGSLCLYGWWYLLVKATKDLWMF